MQENWYRISKNENTRKKTSKKKGGILACMFSVHRRRRRGYPFNSPAPLEKMGEEEEEWSKSKAVGQEERRLRFL